MMRNLEKITRIISTVVLINGCILALVFSYRILFVPNYCDCENQVLFISILLVAGLIGSILVAVLKNIVKEHVSKYMPEIINEFVEKNIEDAFAQFNSEGNVKSDGSTEFDVVVVPAGKTISDIRKSGEYVQQLDRSFKKTVRFIAFYANKEIVGYGEIVKVLEDESLRTYVLKEFIELSIPHLGKSFYVLNRKYTRLTNLLSAASTADL